MSLGFAADSVSMKVTNGMPASIVLPSGRRIDRLIDRLIRFMREEYEYYDAIPSLDPNHIDPLDVMVTVAVNSFVNSAAKVRAVHRAVAVACDPVLAEIPIDADLRTFELEPVRRLIASALTARGVLTAVATKILHRKRRRLIPMLDSVVVGYYADVLHRKELLAWTVEKHSKTADAAMAVLEAMRSDLCAVALAIEACTNELGAHGFQVTALRALEVLLWTDVEPAGYYRD